MESKLLVLALLISFSLQNHKIATQFTLWSVHNFHYFCNGHPPIAIDKVSTSIFSTPFWASHHSFFSKMLPAERSTYKWSSNPPSPESASSCTICVVLILLKEIDETTTYKHLTNGLWSLFSISLLSETSFVQLFFLKNNFLNDLLLYHNIPLLLLQSSLIMSERSKEANIYQLHADD